MNTVYLQLGSNLGDREKMLLTAILKIEKKIGSIVASSKIYESSPWGITKQPNYLNQILKIQTKLEVENILHEALAIENKLGRKRINKWGKRLIDIDIIFYNNLLIEKSNLCVPHKHMHERRFVLLPLNEIASEYIHPKHKKTVEELTNECTDTEHVKEYGL